MQERTQLEGAVVAAHQIPNLDNFYLVDREQYIVKNRDERKKKVKP